MNSAIAGRLIEINRTFYTKFGDSFSATRHRVQPGVRRVLEMLNGKENILDLGCGNGWFARELADRGHRGSYLGLDFSLPLLLEAKCNVEVFPAKFMKVDLTKIAEFSDQLSATGKWTSTTAFAVLHHIPSHKIRLDILRIVRRLLKPGGLFIHSNWQFLNSEKLKSKIQDWSKAGLSPGDVDPNDYLLNWRSGGEGLRYVHHFNEDELTDLAEAAGFIIKDTFYSDGESGNLGMYQVWQN